MTDEEIGIRIRSRGLEEAYVRELLASLGYDPRNGLTMEGISALDNAEMDQRRAAALRTLELGEDGEDDEGDGGEAGLV